MVGDGGGRGSFSSAELPRSTSASEFDPLDPRGPLAADRTDWESALSTLVLEEFPPNAEVDPRGLSRDLLPGILGRRALRSERVDSLVSDLLNDGYESRLGPAPVGVCEPPLLLLSFDA